MPLMLISIRGRRHRLSAFPYTHKSELLPKEESGLLTIQQVLEHRIITTVLGTARQIGRRQNTGMRQHGMLPVNANLGVAS